MQKYDKSFRTTEGGSITFSLLPISSESVVWEPLYERSEAEFGLEIPQRISFVFLKMMKRCLDLIAGTALVLLLIPLFLIICIAIKITSPGPVLFSHLRYGRDGKAFRVFKFRTMATNAAQVLEDHLQRHPERMLEWQICHKLKKDPRITGVGRLLRRYSLDELPQLFNILAGHMSLVGPRPIVQLR